jgi:hypothetical protein
MNLWVFRTPIYYSLEKSLNQPIPNSSKVEVAHAVDGLAPLGGKAGGVDEVVDPVGGVHEEDFKVFHLCSHVSTPRNLTLDTSISINFWHFLE